jgi:DNA-directed RNA polymerase I subunit RPA2
MDNTVPGSNSLYNPSIGLGDLVSDHVNSFNNFLESGLHDISKELKRTHMQFVNKDNNRPSVDMSSLQIWFQDIHLEKPEKNRDTYCQGKRYETKNFPRECREAGETYGGNLMVTVCHKVLDLGIAHVHKNKIRLCSFPVMVASRACNLNSLSKDGLISKGEEETESGGYFIVNGIERIIRLLIQQRRHYVLGLVRNSFMKRGALFSKFATSIRCVNDAEISSYIRLHYMTSGSVNLGLAIERQEFYVPIGIIIRATTDSSDAEIFLQSAHETNLENHLMKDCICQCLREATDAGILTRIEALRHLGKYFRNVLLGQGFVNDVEIGEIFISNYIFTHLKRNREKSNLLFFMLQKLMALVQGLCKPDNPDTLAHQEILLPGSLLQSILYEKLENLLEQIRFKFQVLFDAPSSENVSNIKKILEPGYIQKNIFQVIQKFDIGRRVEYFLATGNLTSKSGLGLNQSSGFTIVADKLNYLRFISHFRSVHRGAYFTELRTTTVRKLLPESWGFLCPIHTPDGAPCGLLNHLARDCKIVMGHQTTKFKTNLLRNAIKELLALDFCIKSDLYQEDLENLAPILLDGRVIGSMHERDLKAAVKILRSAKIDRSSYIPIDLEIAQVNFRKGGVYPGIYMFSSGSRFIRPVFQTEAGNIEYVGTLEQSFMSIKTQDGEISNCQSLEYSHQEMRPDSFLSAVASLTPWSDYNQSPRNMYQCQMGKQTMGVPLHSFPFRSDSKLYRLHTPQRPIALTNTYDNYSVDSYPTGTNAVVAVLSHTGYDMEDAMIMNKFSMERGLAHATLYKTESATLKNKDDSFSILEPLLAEKFDGSPRPGSVLQKGDSLVSITNRTTGLLKRTVLKGDDKAIVDRVKRSVSSRQSSSVEKLNVTLRFNRNPIIGDKFSSRHGQKGVLSYLWPEEDLPFIEKSGIRPDILINPHAFPSRMTIGMLMESLASKSGALSGEFVDASPFRTLYEKDSRVLPEKYYAKLKELGYNFTGTETMINGCTGNTFEVDIFIGLVYYQRLRHMVSDKFQVRSEGPTNPLTKQPIKGRKMGGGIRFGEMERDSLLSHGVANLIQDRLLTCSDKQMLTMCSSCGSLISHLQNSTPNNADFSNHICCTCKSGSGIESVYVPYVYKYLISELAAMNIKICAELQ